MLSNPPQHLLTFQNSHAEVILNPNPAAGYSSIVDAWSIGVVLWCCLTNQTPFDETESEPLALRMRSRQVDMSIPQSLGVSDVAIDFLRKLLNPDPRFRMSCCASCLLLVTLRTAGNMLM